MSEVLERVDKLSPERRALLEKILRKQAGPASEPDAIRPREGGGPAPLSFAQERLWLIDRLEPGSAVYTIPTAWRLRGALDAAALERALGEIVRRHEALRTVFREVDGSPVQAIAPFAGFTLPVEDLSGLREADREADREAAVRRRADEEARRPFDLAEGPLFRAALLRLGAEDHVLLRSMHHVVSDGWSMDVLHRELSALYAAYREGRESPLPALAVQYADYAVWQREQLQGETLDRQLAYWRGRLAGAPELLELPTDHPRPPVQTYRGAAVPLELSLDLLERLQALARSEGATLYMTLLSAFQVLLSKYSGSEDVVVGSPIAGRTRKEVEELIGFFINTLVLRADLGGDPSFRETLRRVRDVTLGAYEHQEVPFEKLVAELQPERSLSHAPLFQVMFTLQNAGGGGGTLAGLEVSGVEDAMEIAKFDLSLVLTETAQGLRGGLNYSTDLFERGTAVRMLGHLARVLEQVAADADVRLSQLELLGDAERALVLDEWNRTEAEYPADRCIHEMFEAQAARTPGAVAVVYEGEALRYAELNARANQLAHALRRRGVGPEVRVGICLERSLELVVSLLAVLKAGGAYVPLDPGYPAERLAMIAADAGLALLLTAEGLRDAVPAPAGLPVLSVDAAWPAIASESTANPTVNPERGAGPDTLAYVIYTSGSTGMPKGVAVAHASLVSHVRWFIGEFQVGPRDRVLQKTPISFDASVWEFYVPLLAGARLVLAAPGGEREPRYLARTVREQEITLLQLVPSLLRVLADEPELRECGALRLLFCGGEALAGDLARRAGALLPAARVVNLYGPTECCIQACTHVAAGEDGARAFVPIGRPVANTRAYVLGPRLQPAAPGIAGELYLGGVQVARGYLGRAALTSERFVPDPFGTWPGGRLYRTGDRARWRADGAIEYLGRLDDQVKVRGFRIEPGEVEAALRRAPGVADCAVVVREDEAGDRRLVAYVVGEAEAEALRAHVRASLPEYMVPAAFVRLDALPLTPNGKLDRKALPAPGLASAADRYVAPRTPVEEVLAGIWAELLRLERVGVEENFFEVGGHSLLATRVVSRVREVFGVELPLRALFEGSTVAALAVRVEEMRRAGLPVLPPVVPVERTGPLPLSFAQERLWFIDRLEPGSTVYNTPMAWRLGGALDAAALERALGEIVRRHEALRTTFADRGGTPVQVIAPFGGFTLPVEDLSGLSEADREAEVLRRDAEEARRAFDLAAGPLFRAALLRLGAEEHVLLLGMHHIVSDAWSMDVFFRELSALYVAYREGRESPLPELPVQYADYAVWQREQLEGETLHRQLAYWRARLAGAPELLELPADRPRPPVQTYRGASVPVELSAELLERLQALGRSEGATLYMTLLSAFQVLLSKYSGSKDVVVGSPIAGRTRGEVEGLIGFFINTLVLRTDLSGDPGFRETLRRVRDVTLGAYEHQEVPFEKLVAELQPERSMSHAPLFQVMFTLQDGGGRGTLPGLEVSGVGADMEIAKFDLSLTLSATAQGLRGGLNYSTDLFQPETVQRMVRHLERVLEQVAADADVRLSRLALTGPEERARVVVEWNRTDRAYPRGVCVHELFQAQVRERPGAAALVWGGESLTYRELDARANQLAHHMVRLGVGPDVRVGVLLERSAELVVSLLAVLKAGGCYVPLDPSYPAERLRLMLADSSVRVLLSRSDLASAVPGCEAHVVRLDELDDVLASEPIDAPRSGATAENLAYIVYTSGSTGKPKGVMVAHRHVVQLVVETDYVQIRPGDRVAQASNASFDALTFEAWGAFLNGATLVGIDRDVLLSPSALRAFLRDERITTLYQTTALLNQLAREQPDIFSSLREVLFGGQAADADSVRRLLKAGGPQRLLHMYGPTETTAWCSWELVAHVADDALTVSVGRPTGNQRIYLLDAALNPVPVGVPGEAYVGGAGVVRGYLDRPGLTAERFVPDPFASDTGARMYRTGDRLRWKADGRLEFIGRVDEQVKIRGFRIEPGEVERVLATHAWVDEVRVIVREDQPGEPRLVAYVVGEVNTHELVEHLRTSLPEYMLPAAIVLLESLPLTPNGKLDVRALPAPGLGSVDAQSSAPRTPTEEVLAGIWADVLRLERVEVNASFFALGGHSLLAIRVVSRIREVFGVELPLRLLFEGPTVAQVAARVEEMRRVGLPMLPPVLPVERTGALPLSFAQERLWLVDRLEPGSAAYNIPVAWRLGGVLDGAALERALGEIVRRHEALRTVFREVDGSPVQTIAPFGGFVLPVEDLSALDEAEREAAVQRRAGEAARRPFDLAAGPLFRAALLRLGDEEHVLLLGMHHIASDGWSMDILFHELSALYAAYRAGGESPLPELPGQYADYAVWQREQLAGDALDRQLAYWRERLAGAPELLELPTDRPRPAVQTFRGATVPAAFSGPVLERLQALGRSEGATLYMVVLAAFQVLLSRYSGSEDVVVGSPVAGRTRKEVEALIGFFVNTLVLRTDLSGDPSFREVLRRVRATTLGAYEHQEVPFERLVAELQPERSLSHAPLFQVAFALEETGGGEGALAGLLPGLEVSAVEAERAIAKFDLYLALSATGQGLRGELNYSTDLFERSTIERMLGHLERVLEQAAADADARLSRLELLGEAERALVLEAWNRTEAEYPADRCIHELFEAQAARTPEAVAVRFEEDSLTYRELNERANQLAHSLRRRGVGPEVRVGICLQRGLETVVSILAVLKAGGAYVPLDPAYPAERIAYMLADSGVPVLLTRETLRGALPACGGVEVVTLDGAAEEIAAESAGNPESGAGPGSLAYVIYTSGSTGAPKGALIEHRNVARLFSATEAWFGFGADDVWTLFHSYAFDFSVWELWGALLYGGRVVVVPYLVSRDPEAFHALVTREGVTVLSQTPSAFRQFIRVDGERGGELALRVVVFGGEALEPASLREWVERRGAETPRLVNMYGITETTVHVTYRPLGREDVFGGTGSPIGVRIPDLRLYVLDAAGEPVPVGVPGELYVGGAGVARGYLNRPELTAERFVRDRFGADAEGRLYRTGDRVRRLADGSLEYLGRLDEQVKIRGFRIELGEIEAALRSHPAAAEAAVVVREDVPGDPRLVSYVVPRRERAPSVWKMLQARRLGLPHPETRELPDGSEVFHLNASETDFLYREIFEDRSYLRHGVELEDGDCVFDVGANIGLFSLFAGRLRQGVRLYAFEPIPPVFEILRENLALYDLDARGFDVGVGIREEEVAFDFYPHASVLSGQHGSVEEEHAVVRSFLRNQQPDDERGGEALLDELLRERLESERYVRPVTTLSRVIDDCGVERIDLLKVDVEKGELEVLRGIREEHWDRIGQVVLEVDDDGERLDHVLALLDARGFGAVVEQDELLRGTGLYNVYAVRAGWRERFPAAARADAPRWQNARELARELRDSVRGTLPEYMVPAAVVLLDALPLTGNGKLDRRALPAPETGSAEAAYVAPRTPAEEVLAGIWAEVLRLERVGAQENFFEAGGHSLLATRVVSRIRAVFGVELPLRALFEAPTVAELAVRVEDMRRAGLPVLPPVVPAGRTGALPLSFAQERLWFLDRLQPGSTAYNMAWPLRLRGTLDTGALERALGEIVRRHEVLRTTFADWDGTPLQVVAPFAGFALPVEDLSGLDEAEREAAVTHRAGEEAQRAFDLCAGPLFHAGLLRLGDDEHVLLLAMHHIVSDGWSMGILLRELSALYAAYRAGGEPPLAELPVQYADYAVWQREQLAGESLERQLAYWRERLAGAPELLELPTDHPRPAVQTFRGADEQIELPGELLERLRDLGRSEGATLYMVVLAAFQVLLSRYSGSEDIVVGSPIAGRTRKEVEELIGFFVNTLVLRTDLSGDPGFREVLRRVRDVTLGAYEHQEVPFEKLVAELQPERSLSHSPLFQVVFTLQNAEGGGFALPGLDVSGVEAEFASTKFDLSLGFSASPRGLRGELSYRTDLFEPGTIQRMARHLERVLEQAGADADVRLSRLELLGPAERAMVLEAWNRTERPYPRGVSINDLFDAQVRERPDAAALVWGGESLTYRELDARANQLAHHLVRLGVGPEVRVGVLLERSAELVVSILAVLKAGGCYVPLDPSYPAERLRLMLADSDARVLLARGGLVPDVAGPDLRVVRLDPMSDALASEPMEAPRSGATAENLAYIVYTSGSTGKPKGVMVAHRHVVQLVCETDYVQIRPGDRIAQASNASFDALTFEAWGAFLNGATLVGIDRDVLLSPFALRAFLRDQRITTLYQTTALLNQLSHEQPDIFASLREVLFGGQAADAESVRRLLKAGGPQRLLHMYGPTETTAWCSWEQVEHVADDALTVSVGRATGNQRIYLLDSALNPVPVGVPGEAYVGGAGVVRGYLERPGLTAERFVPDPFTAEPGARMYRTGDRLRWKADGRLEFIGRVDEQVKIRGFRIEPGEVERVLATHAWVDEVRVIVREDQPGEPRLVAYVVGEVNTHELAEHLRTSLPEYMLPAAIVLLESLPLTPNGKLDVRALPAPGLGSAEARSSAPRTPTEEVLAGIWGDVLRLERVGVHESFFELGGHSLLASRVVSRIQAVFGVDLPLRALFEGPTVAEVAARVEDLRRAGLPVLPPVVPADRTGALPLSFAQERLWFLDRLDPGSTTYNMPWPLRLGGTLDTRALERALGEIVRRHEALRTVFADRDGTPVQVIAPFAGFVLPVEDLSALDEAEREAAVTRRAGEEAQRAFDLCAGPLFHAGLLRLGEEDHVLLLGMHHIVSDGWSMGILFRELSALYAAYREGAESPLAELPVQYADYAVWQREQLAGESLDRQLAYWRERLAGAPELLELPTDHPRPPVRTHRGAMAPVELSLEGLERLQALGRSEGATLYMVVLAAFQVLLSKYGAGDDVVVGSPIAGRTRAEVEELIGFFVNTLVLRTDLAGNPGFRETLRRVRATTLGAYEHQEVPFERLVTELQPERSLSHSPLFQVMFTLQDAGQGGGEQLAGGLGGLETRGVGGELATTKFDLTLGLTSDATGLRGALAYSTDLFEPDTIERMARHLERVLEQVAAVPDQHLSSLDLMGPAERGRVLAEWSHAGVPAGSGRTVHALFQEQAARTPDAVAVAGADGALTYGELDARANRLAHHLVRLGVGSEARAGVLLERSAELVVSLLAVLKAGGCYVPLDPGYPAERLDFMLRDASVSVLLTRERLRDRLPEHGAEVVLVEGITGGDESPPVVEVSPKHLAYVIYTSGSTGTPKGTEVPHRAIPGFFQGADYVRFGAGQAVLQHSSLSWDALTLELWPVLLSGGRCVLFQGESGDVQALAEAVRTHGVTTLWLTSALFDAVVDTAPEMIAGVSQVMTGGEVVSAAHVRRALELNPALRLVNGYGPSECTVFATCQVVEPGFPGASLPVGRPVGDRRVYLLDAWMEPVPAAVPGELFVGGPAVGRGYLERPGLTAERFVPDPFGEPGARMYRTGDRLRWRADGRLEFVGRADEQVKIRGFRVEPGEIEAVLSAHPGVREARVIARADAPGGRRLVAYVVGEAQGEALREHVRERLPDYMVPAAFVVLEQLPRTPNGKLDRRALPAPEYAAGADRYVAPRTPVEEVLAGIWAEVLNLERVGVHDHFFDLGGHSLLVMRLRAHVQATFGLELPVRAVFSMPALDAMAAEIERRIYEDVSALSDDEVEQLVESTPGAGA